MQMKPMRESTGRDCIVFSLFSRLIQGFKDCLMYWKICVVVVPGINIEFVVVPGINIEFVIVPGINVELVRCLGSLDS